MLLEMKKVAGVAELAQWYDRSPLTRFHPGAVLHVVCCWLSPCSKGFSPGSQVLLPPQQPTSPNSISTRIGHPHTGFFSNIL